MEMLVSESVFRRTKAFDGKSRVGSDFPTLRQKGSSTNVLMSHPSEPFHSWQKTWVGLALLSTTSLRRSLINDLG